MLRRALAPAKQLNLLHSEDYMVTLCNLSRVDIAIISIQQTCNFKLAVRDLHLIYSIAARMLQSGFRRLNHSVNELSKHVAHNTALYIHDARENI